MLSATFRGSRPAAKTGTLSVFNAELRQRRLAAQKDGKRFPIYSRGLAKLNRATMTAAATGCAVSPISLFNAVFGD
jgi:hypothetical protein